MKFFSNLLNDRAYLKTGVAVVCCDVRLGFFLLLHWSCVLLDRIFSEGYVAFADWLSWPKCTLKNPVLSHNEFAISERERWLEFYPPPLPCVYVSLEILLQPTRRPTNRPNKRTNELLPEPGDSRPSSSHLSKISETRSSFFSTSVVSIIVFFYPASFFNCRRRPHWI